MLFFRRLKIIFLMLFLNCNPTTNYHPVKKKHEDAHTVNNDKGNEDSEKDSSSEDDGQTGEDDTGEYDTSDNPSEQNNEMEEEGAEEDKKDDDGMDDNQQSPVTEVNYKAPAPYTYPNNYNDPNSDFFPKRHLLVWHENPSSEITINWGLERFSANDKHIVFLSETQHNGIDPENSYELQFSATESGLADSCDNQTHTNLQAKITGLKPNTTYYYITSSKGQKSREMHFVTAPSSIEVSFKLLAGGDSRTNNIERRQHRQFMNRALANIVKNDSKYIGIIHGGDFVASGSNCNHWAGWRDDHQETVLDNGRILPIVATFGNHEIGGEDEFSQLFGFPQGSKYYFLSSVWSETKFLPLQLSFFYRG